MKEIHELNNLLSNYIDQGFFPGVQWQINIDGNVYKGKYGLNNIDTKKIINLIQTQPTKFQLKNQNTIVLKETMESDQSRIREIRKILEKLV